MGIIIFLAVAAVVIGALYAVGDLDEKDRAYIRRMEDAEFKRQMRDNNKPLKTKYEKLVSRSSRLRPPTNNF